MEAAVGSNLDGRLFFFNHRSFKRGRMSLSEQIDDYVRATNTALWVKSYEHEEAIAEIAALCKTNNWVLLTHDSVDGLQMASTGVQINWTKPASVEAVPNEAFAKLEEIAKSRQDVKNVPTMPSTILVLRNATDHIISNPVLRQRIIKACFIGRKSRAFVIVLSPRVEIPVELEKLFTVVEHSLPTTAQLKKVAKTLASEDGEYPKDPAEEKDLLDAVTGMSRLEAENAMSLSIIRHNKLLPSAIWEEKAHSLLQNGLLRLYRNTDATFAQLGGLTHMKDFHKKLLLSKPTNPLAIPRGTLLLSPPGCGKSAFCQALGNEVSMPVLGLNIGDLMGGRVGQSESQTQRALDTADAMAPCVLFIDEVEKGLAGLGGTGASDGGVAQRMFGKILTWMNDHTSRVFVIATCNDIEKILATNPEFVRAERFDGMFFIDLPTEAERDKIWGIWIKAFGISEKNNPRPDDTGWTGAEIRSCCRLSAIFQQPLKTTAKLIVPSLRTAGPQIEALQKWAQGRCLSAAKQGIYGAHVETPKEETEVTTRVISRVRRQGDEAAGEDDE